MSYDSSRFNLRRLDPESSGFFKRKNLTLKNGEVRPCAIRFAHALDLPAIKKLHDLAYQNHKTDGFIYQKEEDALLSLINGKGRTLVLQDLLSQQIISKRSINFEPGEDDLPFLDPAVLKDPVVLGADVTHPDFEGCGAMRLLTEGLIEAFGIYSGIHDAVSVITVGNPGSLKNYLRGGVDFRVRAIGTDALDGSTIMVCHRDFSRDPIKLVAEVERRIVNAMQRADEIQNQLKKGFVGHGFNRDGAMFFAKEAEVHPLSRPVSAVPVSNQHGGNPHESYRGTALQR